MKIDKFAFDQTLVRGLGLVLPGKLPVTPERSSTSGGFVPQTVGDPNYYATDPKFDKTNGYWHAAGTNPPPVAPKITLPQGNQEMVPGTWRKVGTVKRNGANTHLWVWYPSSEMMPSGYNTILDFVYQDGPTTYWATWAKNPTFDFPLRTTAPDYWFGTITTTPALSGSALTKHA